MFDVISSLLEQLVDSMNTFIPIVLVMNLVSSMLFGRGD